jgi:hypothetical protein
MGWTIVSGPAPINTNLGTTEWGQAWLFELRDGRKERLVVVRATVTVFTTGRLQPPDVMSALRSKGLSVVEELLDERDPPPLVTIDAGVIRLEHDAWPWRTAAPPVDRADILDGSAVNWDLVPVPTPPGVLDFAGALLALVVGVLAVILGGIAGATFPEPYLHPAVDPLIACVAAGWGVIAIFKLFEKRGVPRWRWAGLGLLGAGAAAVTSQAFGWSDWDAVSTTVLGLFFGVAWGAMPYIAAAATCIACLVAGSDLVIEAMQDDLDGWSESVGLAMRGVFAVTLVLTILFDIVAILMGERD